MNKELIKIVTLSVLSALAFVLSIFELPFGVAFLRFELSFIVMFVVYVLFGIKEAVVVNIIVTILKMMFTTNPSPFFMGEMIYFFGNLILLISLYGLSKKISNKILLYILSGAIFTILLTFLNYFIFLPIWFTGKITTIITADQSSFYLDGNTFINYVLSIFGLFNVLKATILLSLCAILEGRIKDLDLEW